MRVLRFKVSGQEIRRDENCDFSGIVRGTQGYLRASFSFDKDWDGCRKVASFFDAKGREYAEPIIGGECEIPRKALTGHVFYVCATGAKNGYRIRTNKMTIRQGE